MEGIMSTTAEIAIVVWTGLVFWFGFLLGRDWEISKRNRRVPPSG